MKYFSQLRGAYLTMKNNGWHDFSIIDIRSPERSLARLVGFKGGIGLGILTTELGDNCACK
jgi:hypothetical protein